MKNKVVYYCYILFLIFTLGCAAIMEGTQQQINIQTTPNEAKVELLKDGATYATSNTPCTLMLHKGGIQSLKFTKDGYQPMIFPLSDHVEGWFWANCLLGGIIGMAIDAGTGAMWEYEPAFVNVSLSKMAKVDKKVNTSIKVTVEMYNKEKQLLTTFSDYLIPNNSTI